VRTVVCLHSKVIVEERRPVILKTCKRQGIRQLSGKCLGKILSRKTVCC